MTPKQKPTVVFLDPKTEIQTVLDLEADHVRQTQRFLGERAKLAGDALGLYDLLMRSVDLTAAQDDEENLVLLVMLNMLAGCRFQMTMSVLQNWRGHALEALGPLRRAVELCGSACHVRRNPRLAATWSSASDSNDAYKENKSEFSIKAIFPTTDPTMDALFEVFDAASKVVHCSIYALCAQAEGTIFNYFDRGNALDPSLLRIFLYTLRGHKLILRAFIESFDAALKDRSVLEKEFGIFSERLQRHQDANQDFVLSDLSKDIVEKVKKQAAQRRPTGRVGDSQKN